MQIPPKHHLDVWTIPFQHQGDRSLSTALAYLDPQERIRCEKFRQPSSQLIFAYTRMAVKTILGHYLSLPPQHLSFHAQVHGKPYLTQDPSLQFNWSHTASHALFAMGHAGEPLGVDVETIKIRPFHGIAQQAFSTEERHHLHQLPAQLLPFGFFAFWSQKEAFIKALGVGLRYPLTRLTMPSISPAQLKHAYPFTDPLTRQSWQSQIFFPAPGVLAAVCARPSVHTWNYHVYDPTT